MLYSFYNLTQCGNADVRTVYLRSTDVEQHNYHRLLWSVPDEWLYLLFLDHDICVIDKSTGKGKIGRIFIPVLNDLINCMSMNLQPHSPHLKAHLLMAKDALNKDSSLNKKFEFWTSRLTRRVDIMTMTLHVEKEENPLYKQ
jgi:hypothetical protein